MLLVLLINIIFATTIIVNKMLLQMLSSTVVIGIRMLFGGLILFGLTFKNSSKLRFSNLRQDWKLLLGIALLTSFIPAFLKAYGLKNLLVAKTVLIGSFDQCMTAVYAYLLLHERLSFKKVMGILIVLSGVMISCAADTTLEKTMNMFMFFSYPELAILGYVAVSRFGWTIIAKTLKKEHYSSRELNAVMLTISGSLALGLSFATGDFSHALKSDVSWLYCLALFVYTVFAGNVIGYTLYGMLLKRHSSNFSTLAGFIAPIFVTLLGWLLLNEPLSYRLAISAVVVFFGLYVFYQEEKVS